MKTILKLFFVSILFFSFTNYHSNDLKTDNETIATNRGTFQFQYNNVTYSKSWAQNTAPTKTACLSMLQTAYNKMSSKEKTAFSCAKAKMVKLIKSAGSSGISAQYSKSYYVSQCCPNCIKNLGNDKGARCDLEIFAGSAATK